MRYDLSKLRLLGTVGEPINPEAWMWYHRTIGGERCPIIDTWWQTETGAIMITPLPGVTETKPGTATRAFPGIDVTIMNDAGVATPAGYLAITSPWPSMLRTVWGDDERFKETYWSKWDNIYFPGDGAKIDEDGYLWILGRVDDVLNVAGASNWDDGSGKCPCRPSRRCRGRGGGEEPRDKGSVHRCLRHLEGWFRWD